MIDLGNARVQACSDLVGGVVEAAALSASDHDAGGGDSDDAGEADCFPPGHAHGATIVGPARIGRMAVELDEAVDLTRTGDIWLFRGRSVFDRAIQVSTNSPVNHVGMAVVIDDLPPLMWHAELGRSLPDLWTGKHQRGAQLHDLRGAVLVWAGKYQQQAWFRQLQAPVTKAMEDAVLTTVARLSGTPFPSTRRLAAKWLRGKMPRVRRRSAPLDPESAFCAEVVALTYEAMGLLDRPRRLSWYDPGRFWSGDDLRLAKGARLGAEIAVRADDD